MTWETWRWDPTLFEGAAPYYEQGRPPYAPGLAEAMAHALGLDGTGRLLDVGCGPGRVALLCASHFAEVVGLDPDAGMIEEATRLARSGGVTNARWVRARAEELPLGLGSFRVITFAASFHWMERERVAAAVRAMLDGDGVVIHVDTAAYRPDPSEHREGLRYPAPPDALITDLRARYIGPATRAGQSIRETSPGGEDDIFRAAGLDGPRAVVVPDGREMERTVDDIVAYVFSGSAAAPHLFGDAVGDFEADLRALLHDVSPTGCFSVRLPATSLKIWRPA